MSLPTFKKGSTVDPLLGKTCAVDFNTSFAYIIDSNICAPDDKDKISIENYLSNENLTDAVKNKKKFLVCKRGHALMKYESSRRENHFQHINHDDTKMTIWHSEWQSNFPVGMREVEFKKKSGQCKRRFADVSIFKKSLEFQHSRIRFDEVKRRQSDHLLHGNKIFT